MAISCGFVVFVILSIATCLHADDSLFDVVSNRVQEMYTEYPFPLLPDEIQLTSNSVPRRQFGHPKPFVGPSHYPDLVHYFNGGYPLQANEQNPFRVLFAGGGTGVSMTQLALQLKAAGVPAVIVHFDLTGESIDIAKKLSSRHGLDNIRFVQGSLLDLSMPMVGGQPFDYIDCTGVIHHIPAPDVVLENLRSVLAPKGVIGLSVYGEVGRTAVYQWQKMMKILRGEGQYSILNHNHESLAGTSKGRDLKSPSEAAGAAVPQPVPLEKQLHALNVMRDSAPGSNWGIRSNKMNWEWATAPTHAHGDGRLTRAAVETDLVDTYLHAHDVPFDVYRLLNMTADKGFKIHAILEEAFYDVSRWVDDDEVLAQVATLPWEDQLALGELFHGGLTMHTVYLAKAAGLFGSAVPALPTVLHRPDAILIPRVDDQWVERVVAPAFRRGPRVEILVEGGSPMKFRNRHPKVAAVIARMLPQRVPISDMFIALCQKVPLDWNTYMEAVSDVYELTHGLAWVTIQYSGPFMEEVAWEHVMRGMEKCIRTP
eukprot:Rmarinus@m.28469